MHKGGAAVMAPINHDDNGVDMVLHFHMTTGASRSQFKVVAACCLVWSQRMEAAGLPVKEKTKRAKDGFSKDTPRSCFADVCNGAWVHQCGRSPKLLNTFICVHEI